MSEWSIADHTQEHVLGGVLASSEYAIISEAIADVALPHGVLIGGESHVLIQDSELETEVRGAVTFNFMTFPNLQNC